MKAGAQPDLSLPAPAKLNLFLHVLGRRADGYHELQTLFQLLDYGDQLEFHRTPDGGIAVAVYTRFSKPDSPGASCLNCRSIKFFEQMITSPKLGPPV